MGNRGGETKDLVGGEIDEMKVEGGGGSGEVVHGGGLRGVGGVWWCELGKGRGCGDVGMFDIKRWRKKTRKLGKIRTLGRDGAKTFELPKLAVVQSSQIREAFKLLRKNCFGNNETLVFSIVKTPPWRLLDNHDHNEHPILQNTPKRRNSTVQHMF